MPRGMELGVASTYAVSEPRAAATTATAFPRFRDDATFPAFGPDGRRHGSWCVCVGIIQNSLVCTRILLHVNGIELTFASHDALRPRVICVSVAGTATVLIPSTARSATTNSPRFLERAALGTLRAGRHGNWRPYYKLTSRNWATE